MGGCGRSRVGAAAAAGWVMVMTAACAGGRPPGPVPPGHAAVQASPVAARFLAIAVAGNRRLEIDFDRLDGRDRSDLAAAHADLRDAAGTERLFDQRLAGITFPAATETIARLLILSNQARSKLTEAAANSVSLAQLRAYEQQLTAANGPVEEAVGIIRSQLGLRPPETS